jgi:ATP-dependent DNA helicase RecG
LLERGVVHFEAQTPSGACLDDLDFELVSQYILALGLPSGATPEEVLHRRGCLRLEQGRNYSPTYAALLLFGKFPQQWLPGATILAARFSGSGLADQYLKQEMRGTLPQQLRQADAFVRDQLRSLVRLDGLAHTETGEFPFDAVRELLVNAVAHRDYNLQGDTIHINIFSDRLEVHSPGGLPGPVTLSNLLEARFSRNAVIVQVLSDLGFVERLGYGLDRVMAALREAGLRPPRFEETAGTFRVTLFARDGVEPQPGVKDLSHLDFNPRQQAALNFLARRPRITSSDYQELCPGVHVETLRRDLVDLVSRGVLIKVGDKRATYYILR